MKIQKIYFRIVVLVILVICVSCVQMYKRLEAYEEADQECVKMMEPSIRSLEKVLENRLSN